MLKIYPFLWENESPCYKTQMIFFLHYIPKPGIPQGGARMGKFCSYRFPITTTSPWVQKSTPRQDASEMHSLMEATLKLSLHCCERECGTSTGVSWVNPPLLQGTYFLLESLWTASQQWYQRVAKGNPQTAKSVLDVN